MTEQEKEMVRQSIQDHAAPMAQRILQSLDAKLSPKHPRKGDICEVWRNDWDNGETEIRIAGGCGVWLYPGSLRPSDRKYDHYREIPTAKAALALLDGEYRAQNAANRDGLWIARDMIEHLIDNAKEG